jgi:hypothetical protein
VASIFSDFLQLGALWNATTAQLGIELMGDAAFKDAIQGAVERDTGICDGVVLLIAFALLALMLRSARVLLSVVLSLVVSALVVFGSMFGVTFAIDVMSATSLMMSLAIALSIDYGLFLSVTFRESLRWCRYARGVGRRTTRCGGPHDSGQRRHADHRVRRPADHSDGRRRRARRRLCGGGRVGAGEQSDACARGDAVLPRLSSRHTGTLLLYLAD